MLLLVLNAFAEEGMWLPEQVPALAAEMKSAGLELDPAGLADPLAFPLGAIVSLNGWCSASFVSPDGLIATNHHCVADYLQQNSTAEQNRAKDGFVAHSRAEELWAGPAARLYLPERFEDVTAAMTKVLTKKGADADRQARVQEARNKLVKECEVAEDIVCEVVEDYGGRSWRRITYREIRDVRLVYVPPMAVGNYGAEIDNFMWPRHSGDVSFVRAYVGKDGKPADHAADNVPYKPKHWLKVDPTGAQEGEFVFVAGFPGHTERHATLRSVVFDVEQALPFDVGVLDQVIKIIQGIATADPAAAPRLQAPIDNLGNGLKYRQGVLDNFRDYGVLALKEADWARLLAYIEGNADAKARYAPVLAEMDTLEAEQEGLYRADRLVGWMLRFSDLLSVAHTAVRLTDEGKKPDGKRDPGTQDRDVEDIVASSDGLENSMVLAADLKLLAFIMEQIQALPAQEQPAPVVAWWKAHSGELADAKGLLDPAARKALLEGRKARDSKDPYVGLAMAAEDWLAPRRARAKERSGAWLRLTPLYMQALLDSRGGRIYPDANGTLRITWGRVEGYSPKDGLMALPRTTAKGMAAKAGAFPFDLSEAMLANARAAASSPWADPQAGDLVVDFLSSVDTTGGNSGSATMNGKGELVGFIFDGNYESMSADQVYDPALTRSIHVDIRFVLWLLDGAGAGWVVDEMGVPRK